jgi:hypothetical protein
MIGKRLSRFHGPAWLVAFVLVVAAIACTLNPQPIPPLAAESDAGSRGETSADGSMSTGPSVDAAAPLVDAGVDIHSTDAGDAGDAGDAADAGDAGDADAQ